MIVRRYSNYDYLSVVIASTPPPGSGEVRNELMQSSPLGRPPPSRGQAPRAHPREGGGLGVAIQPNYVVVF